MTTGLKTFIILAGLALTFSSCKRNIDFTPTQRAALIFHMHHYINDTKVTTGTMGYDDSGRRYQLSQASFYISQITLHNSDGTDWQSYGRYTLVNLGGEEYLVDSVPVGNYRSITFTVGLDPTTNAGNPAQHATGPLSPQSPSMYFGDGQGYIFMNVQGKADTTAAQNGLLNTSFSYQVGTDNLARKVSMPNHSFSMVAHQSQILDIKVDYSVFLQSLNFKTQPTNTPFTDQIFATTLANREQKMFSWGL